MLRRLAPPHVLLTAYCGGLLLSLLFSPPAQVLVAAAGIVTLGGLIAWRSSAGRAGADVVSPPQAKDGGGSQEDSVARGECLSRSPLVVVIAGLSLTALAAGMLIGSARLDGLGRSSLAGMVNETATLSAVLEDLPDIDEGQVTLVVKVSSAGHEGIDERAHLRLRLDEGQRFSLDPCGPLSEGALLRIQDVRIRPLPEAEPGAFDYGRYLRRRGEHVLLEADFADVSVTGRRGGVRGAADALRRASRAHLHHGLRAPVRDVLQGMVLGDDEGVDEQLIEDFRRSGLLHIMAVSGENVVLLCSMWSFAFVLLAIPRLPRTALLVPVVATYVVLTGASPSIVRAGVAGIVGLLAVMVSRPSDGWLLWLAPGAWLLTANPNNLFDVSFQLSFGAVAGLLVLAKPLTRLFDFLPGPLPEQIGVTMAASIATAPVSMLTFGSASLVSVPANVAGGFVLGPIMFLGMLSLLLGFVGSWLSAPLNLVAGLFIGFLLGVARLFGRLPWAVYEWQGVKPRLAFLVVAAAFAAVVWLLARRAGEGCLPYVRARLAPLVTVAAGLIVVVLLLAPSGPAAPARPTLTFLDVGEGASSLLQAPSGATVLVDAGPAPLARALREHGVEDIDLLVVSHGHADHVGGLDDVVGSVSIEVALLPQPPEPDAALERLAARLSAAGVDVRRCREKVTVGEAEWSLDVLPTKGTTGGGNQGENDNALVVVAALAGHRVLLPGDAEGAALSQIGIPPCDVVGVPHHGSADGFDAALLAALRPRLAVIPVGPNRHGHPSGKTLELLVDVGIPYARTDLHGDIAVAAGGDQGLMVMARRRP